MPQPGRDQTHRPVTHPSPQRCPRPAQSVSPVCCSVVAAWVGDSRAVYYAPSPRGMLPLPLTEDHKPDKLAEAVRILSAGGWVSQVSSRLDLVQLRAGCRGGRAVRILSAGGWVSQVGAGAETGCVLRWEGAGCRTRGVGRVAAMAMGSCLAFAVPAALLRCALWRQPSPSCPSPPAHLSPPHTALPPCRPPMGSSACACPPPPQGR